MKWIGQHIWSFITRFRNKVYFEDLEPLAETTALVVDSDGKVGTNSLSGGGGSLPAGGTDFQVLRKVSNTDYDVEWDYADRTAMEVRFDEAVSKGDPLYITGFNSGQNRVTVAKADASDANKMPSIGLAFGNYSVNDNGQAVTIGNLDNVNTQVAPNAFQEGDVLYVKAGGGLTNVKPIGTNLIQNVGKVSRSQQNNGEIVVMAIGRSNDVPNLPTGKFFIGSPTNTKESSYTLPNADGSDGQALVTDGSGEVSFQDLPANKFTYQLSFEANCSTGNYYFGNSRYGWNFAVWNYSDADFLNVFHETYNCGIPVIGSYSNIKMVGVANNDSYSGAVIEFELWKQARPNGSGISFSPTSIGSVSVDMTVKSRQYNVDFSASDNISDGDLIFLTVRRTTGSGTTYVRPSLTIELS